MKYRMGVSRCCCDGSVPPPQPTEHFLQAFYVSWDWPDFFGCTSQPRDPLLINEAGQAQQNRFYGATCGAAIERIAGVGFACFDLNDIASDATWRLTSLPGATPPPPLYATSTVTIYYELTDVTSLAYEQPIPRSELRGALSMPWAWLWGQEMDLIVSSIITLMQADGNYTLGQGFRIIVEPDDAMLADDPLGGLGTVPQAQYIADLSQTKLLVT